MPSDVLTLQERVRGGLLGLACGDALGAPVKSMARDAIRRRFGRVTEMMGGGPLGLAPGEGTDETAMALAVAEGLAEGGEDPREAVGRRLVAWLQAGPREVEATVRAALTHYLAAGDWEAAMARTRARLGDRATGNGSLVRTLAVSYAYLHRPDRMRRQAARLSEMTHPHELPTLVCIYYNELVRQLALGVDREEALERAREAAGQPDVLVSYRTRQGLLERIDGVWRRSYPEVRATGSALDTLTAALWIFRRAGSLEEALVEAVGLGDEADAVGAVVGGLAGTLWGAGAIPARWLEVLRERERLEQVALRLGAAGGGEGGSA